MESVASHDRNLTVLYGSQTGNAVSVAADICREAARRHIRCTAAALNDAVDDLSLLNVILNSEAEEQGAAATRQQQKNCVASVRHVVFVVSTTGQGAAPTNMTRFWNCLLHAHLDTRLFSHLRFSVFGLGDTRYPQFNFAARRLHRRLLQLSAVEFWRLGLGDDQHDFGYEGEFDPWLEGLLDRLEEIYPLPPGETVLDEAEVQRPKYIVKGVSGGNEFATKFDSERRVLYPRPYGDVHTSHSNTSSGPAFAELVQNTRMTSDAHFQDVRSLQLRLSPDLSDSLRKLQPGASISLYPSNPIQAVESILGCLGLAGGRGVSIRLSKHSDERRSPFPTPPTQLSLFELFRHFLDILKVPDRFFFRYLSTFTSDEEQKEKLEEIGGRSPESKDFYYEYCKLEKRSYSDIFWDFPSARPPIDHLLSMIPIIQPRKYSIACDTSWYNKSLWWPFGAKLIRSSPLLELWASPFAARVRHFLPQSLVLKRLRREADSNSRELLQGAIVPQESILDLCFGVVEFKTRLQRPIVGLCSSFVRSLKVGDKIPVSLADALPAVSFPDLENLRLPLVMVAPGTGVAPCRAIIQRRYRRILEFHRRSPVEYAGWLRDKPHDVIFLGFRNLAADFLFGDEWMWYSSCPKIDVHSMSSEACIPTRDANVDEEKNRKYDKWLDVHVAFSRDRDDKKVYVQDLIEEQGAAVYKALRCGGAIIISGRSHPMPAQVDDALLEVFEKFGEMSSDAAAKFLRLLKAERRHVCDTWG